MFLALLPFLMDLKMWIHVAFLSKRFSTNTASKWFLSCMNTLVQLHVCTTGFNLGTESTAVNPDAVFFCNLDWSRRTGWWLCIPTCKITINKISWAFAFFSYFMHYFLRYCNHVSFPLMYYSLRFCCLFMYNSVRKCFFLFSLLQ